MKYVIKIIIFTQIILLLFTRNSHASRLTKSNDEGIKLYSQKKYDDALKSFSNALLDNPISPELHFNKASTLYKQGKYKEAIEEYEKSLKSDDKDIVADTYYDMGNCQFRAGKLVDAIQSYIKTLEIRPDDVEAKFNLELARMKLKELMQKQQKQQKKENKSGSCNKKGPGAMQNSGKEKNKWNPPQKKPENPPESPFNKGGNKEIKDKMKKEDAIRILQALDNMDKETQKKAKRIQIPGQGFIEKDW